MREGRGKVGRGIGEGGAGRKEEGSGGGGGGGGVGVGGRWGKVECGISILSVLNAYQQAMNPTQHQRQ